MSRRQRLLIGILLVVVAILLFWMRR